MPKRPSKRWTKEETKAFLHFYSARKNEFQKPHSRKKRIAYGHILEDMISAGFDSDIEINHLEVKMTTLLRSYKTAKDNAGKTGASPCPPPFMEEMDEIFGDKPIHSESDAFNAGAQGLFEDTKNARPSVNQDSMLDRNPHDIPVNLSDQVPSTSLEQQVDLELPVEIVPEIVAPGPAMAPTPRTVVAPKSNRFNYFRKRLEQRERDLQGVSERWKQNCEYRDRKIELIKQILNK